MQTKIQKIIEQLGLTPHPEGGYFRETYRSNLMLQEPALHNNMEGERNCCTSIYFLLTSDSFSAFHRIKQDEIWHFYSGSPVEIHMIGKEGKYSMISLGFDFDEEILPQFTVEANTWFAAIIVEPNSYALVGCTVSPGFDFRDFEMANRAALISTYPEHRDIITRYTR